ncbi:tetratricopeptide repeat protein [Pedobacter sp. MW01-1-1]|uniref:tetratricopeptide repeat protein n=1 Tax=Pedobacter sp. MW01-1-1 TaxID=3383027 RepID=UPI003FEFBDA6
MKRVILSVFLAGVSTFTFAQKSEVAEAKKQWGMFQLTKKAETLKEVISHTDKAIADEKSKIMVESWSYRALAASTLAVLDTTSIENADANIKIAQEAVAEAKKLDTKGAEKDNIANADLNIANAVRNGGIIAYNKKDFKKAFEKFSQSTEINPNDTAMYLNAGITAKMIEDYPNAIKNFKKAIELNVPQSKDLYSEVIDINLRLQKDTTAGLENLKAAQVKFPDNPDYIKTETQIYINRGDAAKSEQMLTALAAKEPNNANYQVLLGNIYFSQALNMQNDRKNIDSKKDVGGKQYNALTTKMNGLVDKSLPFYKKALEIEPNNQGALETLKTIYAFKNDTPNYEAIKKRLDALPKQ